MTPHQLEVLDGLEHLDRLEPGRGWRPLDFGGHNGSHHGQTATRLIPSGWVERNFGLGWDGKKTRAERGSARYRITEKGKTALANWLATQEMARKRRG